MKDLNVTVANSANQVIRIGEAETIHPPVKVEIEGDINAPMEWVRVRLTPDSELCKHSNVIFNHVDCTIKLVVNESDKFATEIMGKVTKNKFLSGLRINNPNGYRIDQLKETFKFAGMHFLNRTGHVDLMGKLKTFDAKVFREYKAEEDRTKGIKNNTQNSKVDTELNGLSIVLNIPILEGFDRQTITITVEVEDSNGPLFFLACHDIEEVVEDRIETVFKAKEVFFSEFGIVCIHQR